MVTRSASLPTAGAVAGGADSEPHRVCLSRDHGEGPEMTFVVAAYNVEAFIEIAVRSALAQIYVSVEVIVVDDASSDGTAAVVERLAADDPRVILIKNKQNVGPGAARNIAIQRARGRWIAILDGDDCVAADRASKMIACANATGADIVGDNFERITAEGTPTRRLLFSKAGVPFLFFVEAPAFIAANELLGNRRFSLGAIKVVVKSEFLRTHDIRHFEDLPVGEDFHFILTCLFRGGKFVVSSDPGYRYRIRPGSQSWRLTDEHMTRLQHVHELLIADAKRSESSDTIDAVDAYGRSLARTTQFVRIVSLAKAGLWSDALRESIMSPHVWPLVVHSIALVLANRLLRYRLGTSTG